MKKLAQRTLHCPCGRLEIIANGLCWTCYTLKRQDEEYFGGLREVVLKRDGYMCRVCAELPEIERLCAGKRLTVHHRVPGVSEEDLMISLCTPHHAIVTRTQFLDKCWTALLTLLWREQHPDAHEQLRMDFRAQGVVARPVALFAEGTSCLEQQGFSLSGHQGHSKKSKSSPRRK